MLYREAFDYINSFTNYEKVPGLIADLDSDGLERFRLLLRLLGRPHLSFKSVVVAGTKGKGSVAAMLEAVLRMAGFRTALFTSPHLHTFRERIRAGGQMISPLDMGRITEQVKAAVERIRALGDPSLLPTTYELATALAFLYFKEQKVEYAVLEVGLGGRLDAVNVTTPLVSVITSISMDHMEVLGDTLAKIAYEKAGIIKQNGIVVSAPQHEEAMRVIESVAADRKAALVTVGREVYVGTGHLPEVISDEEGVPVLQAFTVALEAEGERTGTRLRVVTPLLGNHQQVNAAVALAALRVLEQQGIAISGQAVFEGLRHVDWPGRLEVVHRNPLVIVDGAHNVESFARLGAAMSDLFPRRDIVLVAGISRDKNVGGILAECAAWTRDMAGPNVERMIVTRSDHPRAADPKEVAQQAVSLGLTVEMRQTVPDALSRAEAVVSGLKREDGRDPIVLVSGSLFVVAEARRHYGLAPDLSEEK